MNKTTLAAALILLAGCDSHDDESDHDHGHGHDATQEAPPAVAPPTATPPPAPAAAPIEAALGDATVKLAPTADSLRLTLVDASGAAIAPGGEARVVLTPTGGEEQRIVLKADGDGWSGPAAAVGASGYVAVVSLQRDGQTQTARLAWGDAPEAPEVTPEAPPEASHDDGDHAHGHGHDH
ncbi:MAG: hypothetical protein ACI8RZ_000596 [Myxococcota bacterium]|jgi:hypothetical protein